MEVARKKSASNARRTSDPGSCDCECADLSSMNSTFQSAMTPMTTLHRMGKPEALSLGRPLGENPLCPISAKTLLLLPMHQKMIFSG